MRFCNFPCVHNYHHRRSCGTVYSVPCSPPRSPPPSPVPRKQLYETSLTSIPDICEGPEHVDSGTPFCNECVSQPNQCTYFFHRLDHELHRLATSIPMSLNKAASMSRCWLESGCHSRSDSSLELEAIAAVHQLSIAVQTISISEMLPRTPELIFVNVTTLEGQPYCLELTAKGWRVTSLRSDCMQGDFTRMELFTKYYDSLYDLMEFISPNYKQRFSEKLEQRLRLLETEGDDLVAPSSSYINSPNMSDNPLYKQSSMSNSSESSSTTG